MSTDFNISGGPRVAWMQKGRRHRLAGDPPEPPEDKKHAGWYMEGYRAAAKEAAARDRDLE